MSIPLRQSTDSQEITLGVFLDDTDGKTPETGLTIANTDIQVWKHGATTLANKNSGGATHDAGGVYIAVLDATDTNTPGCLAVYCQMTGALPVKTECVVLPAKIYDSLFGSDNLEIDVVLVAGAAVTGVDDFKANVTNLDAAVSTRLAAADYAAPLNAAGVRTAVGLATANLDTQLAGIPTILEDTGELQTDWHDGGRLDLLLDAVAVPTGTNTVTITVNDGTNPIADVTVYIYDSTNTVFVTSVVTNASGVATIYLNNAVYARRLLKTGATFTNPATLTVSGNTSVTYSGTAVTIGAPDDSDACRVYEFCYDQDGATPLTTVTATATIKTTPYDYDDKLHSVVAVTGTYNSTTGLLYWDIVKGARVKFTITQIGVNSTVEIPTTVSTKRLADLL